MLAVWEDWGLDKILKNAYNSGVIMCGVSAGAICWFQKGVTDSWSDELRVMDCLGFVKGTCCPHYDEEPERRPFVSESLSNNIIDSCYSVDGGCALHMIDEKPFRSIVFEKDKNAFLVTMDDSVLNEERYRKREIF
jgi:aminopeptidase N